MYPFAGARLISMGSNGENFRDANALFFNQAGIAFVNKTTIMAAAENRFFAESLTQGALGVLLPAKNGAFGFSGQFFGNQYYTEGSFGMAYSRLLSEDMAIGTKVNYHFVQVEEGGSQGVFLAQLGIQQKVLPWLQLGAHIFNPIRARFANGYQMPAIFRLGALFTISEKVDIASGIEKAIDEKINVKFGTEYQAAKRLYLRFGIQSNPRMVSGGFGIHASNKMKLDFAANWHQILGISPAFTFAYQFGS
jgi:hypothetical protein